MTNGCNLLQCPQLKIQLFEDVSRRSAVLAPGNYKQSRQWHVSARTCSVAKKQLAASAARGQCDHPAVEKASRRLFVTFKLISSSCKHVPAVISSDLMLKSHSLRSILLIPKMINDVILRSDTSKQVKRCDVTISKHY